MPATITTEVFTLDELRERGDEAALDRALDWMGQVFADFTVEDVTAMIDNVLDELCGTHSYKNGWRQAPIMWGEWSAYPAYVTLKGDFTPDDLDGPEFPAGHVLDGLPEFPSDVLSVSVDGYGLSVVPLDEDNTEAVEREVACWLDDLSRRLAALVRDEYDYQTSRDYLLECAESNGYTFTVDGKRFG
jgi:hypothetical protein